MYQNHRYFLLLGLFLVLLCVLTLAQPSSENPKEIPLDLSKVEKVQDVPKEKTGVSKILPPVEILYFHYIFQPSNEIKNIEDLKFDLNQYRVGVSPSFEIAPQLYLDVGVHYHAYNFRFEYFDEDNDEYRTLHSLSFPFGMTYVAEEWIISGQITTSLNSDFRGFNRHDAQVNGGVIAGYLFHPTFLLQIGVMTTNDFGDLNVIPVGGFIWKPSDMFDISMLIPFSATANFHFNEKFTLFAYYELDGNQFRFRYREFGKVFEEDGQFTFYRMGLGCKLFMSKGISAKLILGGTSDGRYEFQGLSTSERDGRIKGTFFLLAGITIDQNILK